MNTDVETLKLIDPCNLEKIPYKDLETTLESKANGLLEISFLKTWPSVSYDRKVMKSSSNLHDANLFLYGMAVMAQVKVN